MTQNAARLPLSISAPLAAAILLALAACSTAPNAPAPVAAGGAGPVAKPATGSRAYPGLPAAGSGRGGYYLDDGPGDVTPEGLMNTPNAVPRIEPYSRAAGKPYVVFGQTYTPMMDDRPFKQRGIGSWYGKKFHGQKTSSGELYDMYKMTAAHPTLPIPSYAKVTNLKTGTQIIVRVNDRGPFHSSRIIDLSYTAALKLGYLGSGSSELEVERLLPDDILQMQADLKAGKPSLLQAGMQMPAASPVSGPPTGALATQEPVSFGTVETRPLEGGPTVASIPAPGAAPVGAPPPLVASAAVVPPVAGFYLQFGAFSQEANAEAARQRLLPGLSGVVDAMQTVPVNGLYRLYSGPYPSRGAAQDAAQQIKQRGSVAPFVVQR